MHDAIPDGWRRTVFGDLFEHRTERAQRGDALLSVTKNRGVITQELVGRRDVSSAVAGNYWRVYPGDIAYNTMRMWQGVSGCSSLLGAVSPAYTVCTPKAGQDSRFLAHLLHLPEHVIAFRAYSQGLVSDTWNLKFRAFAGLSTSVPAAEAEQRNIAEVLDLVDRAILDTEVLIAKLQQMKQGLLHDLLTRGVDENGKLRDPIQDPDSFKESPLGPVPRTWELRAIGEVAEVFNGTTPSRAGARYWRGGSVPWLSSGSVNDYVIREGSGFITDRAVKDYGLRIVPRGSVVVGLIGQGRTRGMSARVEIDTTINQNLAAVVPTPEAMGQFLHHYLCLNYERLRSQSRGSNQDALNCYLLARFLVALPPIREQQLLCQLLSEIDATRDAEEHLLYKYMSLRAGLASDLLTGRVRTVPLESTANA
jgi:type I restriction enzyme, S subunit